MKNAIFKYKNNEELIVKVIETTKIISNGYGHLSIFSNISTNKWSNLIIKFENDKILEDKPYHFTLIFLNDDGFVYSKIIILEVYSYEKNDDNNIIITFGDCLVIQ